MPTEYALEPLTYYKWKWQKFRADRRVQRMDYICKGIYRELLDECWVKGYVLSNLEDLAEIVGCEEEVIEKYWHMLSKCLVLLDNGKRLHNLARDSYEEEGNHKLVSSSLNEERTAKDEVRIKRSISGTLGGKAKSNNGKDLQQINEANASKCLANESECHIEEKRREEKSIEEKSKNTLSNPADKTIKKITNADDDLEFMAFYDRYNNKVGREKAFKAWKRLNKADKIEAFDKVEHYFSTIKEGISKVHPSTYLSTKRWTDEIDVARTAKDFVSTVPRLEPVVYQ